MSFHHPCQSELSFQEKMGISLMKCWDRPRFLLLISREPQIVVCPLLPEISCEPIAPVVFEFTK
jgi:hypothetical protein